MPKDDQAEYFIEVDDSDREIGRISRLQAHSGSFRIHRSIAIIIENQDHSKILLQQRSAAKDVDPGMWSYAVGGHVSYGESYLKAARRELKEELGILAPLTLVNKSMVVMPKEREYTAFFLAAITENTNLAVDSEEVEQTLWVDKVALQDFVDKNKTAGWTIEALRKMKFL